MIRVERGACRTVHYISNSFSTHHSIHLVLSHDKIVPSLMQMVSAAVQAFCCHRHSHKDWHTRQTSSILLLNSIFLCLHGFNDSQWHTRYHRWSAAVPEDTTLTNCCSTAEILP